MATESKEPRLMTLKEVVKEYGATLWFWRTRVWRKELPVLTAGNKQLLDRRDIEVFIEQNKHVAN